MINDNILKGGGGNAKAIYAPRDVSPTENLHKKGTYLTYDDVVYKVKGSSDLQPGTSLVVGTNIEVPDIPVGTLILYDDDELPFVPNENGIEAPREVSPTQVGHAADEFITWNNTVYRVLSTIPAGTTLTTTGVSPNIEPADLPEGTWVAYEDDRPDPVKELTSAADIPYDSESTVEDKIDELNSKIAYKVNLSSNIFTTGNMICEVENNFVHVNVNAFHTSAVKNISVGDVLISDLPIPTKQISFIGIRVPEDNSLVYPHTVNLQLNTNGTITAQTAITLTGYRIISFSLIYEH